KAGATFSTGADKEAVVGAGKIRNGDRASCRRCLGYQGAPVGINSIRSGGGCGGQRSAFVCVLAKREGAGGCDAKNTHGQVGVDWRSAWPATSAQAKRVKNAIPA